MAAARRGQIRCLAIVVVNPLHESEGMFAGSNDPTHGVTLVGALTRLSKKILETL